MKWIAKIVTTPGRGPLEPVLGAIPSNSGVNIGPDVRLISITSIPRYARSIYAPDPRPSPDPAEWHLALGSGMPVQARSVTRSSILYSITSSAKM